MYTTTIVCLLALTCKTALGIFFGSKTTTELPHNVTTQAGQLNLDKQSDDGRGGGVGPVEREAGAIVGAVFGVLVSVGFLSAIGIMYIRRKRQRDREYMRELKVMQSSRQSSGVYMDTSTDMDLRSRDLRGGSKYSSVPRDPNIYEDDSEDELWSASNP